MVIRSYCFPKLHTLYSVLLIEEPENENLIPTIELDNVYETWMSKIENNDKVLMEEYKVQKII